VQSDPGEGSDGREGRVSAARSLVLEQVHQLAAFGPLSLLTADSIADPVVADNRVAFAVSILVCEDAGAMAGSRMTWSALPREPCYYLRRKARHRHSARTTELPHAFSLLDRLSPRATVIKRMATPRAPAHFTKCSPLWTPSTGSSPHPDLFLHCHAFGRVRVLASVLFRSHADHGAAQIPILHHLRGWSACEPVRLAPWRSQRLPIRRTYEPLPYPAFVSVRVPA
jgi:hypothetical protein